MHCTHTDLSGSTRSKCGTAEFALTVSAMLTVDLSGEEQDHTVDLDGLAHEDIDLVCKKCGNPLEGPEFVKVVTLLILKLEKRLGAGMAPFSSYTFNDGTVIHPDQLQVTPLRDVTMRPRLPERRQAASPLRTVVGPPADPCQLRRDPRDGPAGHVQAVA